MSLSNSVLYNSEGLIRGSYVYMLVCRDGDGPVYVKVGITDSLDNRLQQLRAGCPVTPLQFFTLGVPNRRRARLIERRLHSFLQDWWQQGEWFCLDIKDKPRFNAEISSALASLPAKWRQPLKWERVAVQPLVRLAAQRKSAYLNSARRRGRAYADFQKDSCA
jgi:hypothetical protein